MKTKYIIRIITALITLAVIILPFFTLAQGGPGDSPDAPIDGGLSLLLAAGAGYGIKKYRDGRKKKSEIID